MTLKVPDICAWFQQQQGAARLETIVNLLQMLYPLELQFVGAYLEDLARRDYHCLRDVEHRFNIPEIVARLTDVNDGRCRASLIVALSLLKSSNQKTAATVYRILLSFHVVYRQLPKTKDVYEEILLLLTMAKHHPAFKFDQKTSVAGLLEEIDHFLQQNEPHSSIGNEHDLPEHPNTPCDHLETSQHFISVDASTQTSVDDYEIVINECVNMSNDVVVPRPDGEPCPTAASSLASSPDLKASDVYVTHVKVKGSQKKENMIEFTLETVWSNNEVTEVVKTQEDLYEFHRKLLDIFPSDAGCYGYNRRIPYFPGYRHSPELEANASPAPEITQLVFQYIQDFLAVDEDILASRYAANFFKPSSASSNDVRPMSSVSPDANSSYCLNMLFEPNSRPPTTYKKQNSNDTGSNEDDQDFVDNEGRVKSLIYYNSHMSTTSPKGQSSPKSTTLAESSASCNLISKTVNDSSQIIFSGGDVSSTSRVVPLPPPLNTVANPRTAKDSSASSSSYDAGSKLYQQQQPLLFVPKELYFILRRENLLKYKKYFVPFKIEDLLNFNTEADIDEQMDVSADDKKEVLRVLNILKHEITGHSSSPKNGFFDKRHGFAHHLQRKFENWDLDNHHDSSADRSYTRAPSTSSVDTIVTDDNGPTRFVNGETNDTDHSDSMYIGRSNSTSAVATSIMSQSASSSTNNNRTNRPKSFHRHHSKNQLRKYSIPLNVERYGGSVDDNNILSDSSCVSETPVMMHHNEEDYQTTARGFFGVSPLPSEVPSSVGRGRPITKMSNSLPPSKSQSPVPNDLSPAAMGFFQSPFGQRKAMTPGVGGVYQPPPMNFGLRGFNANKPQPIRCLYPPTSIVDSSQSPNQQNPVRLNHYNYQPPSLPPPSAVAYDMSRSNVPMFALPPPGSQFGFIRGPPPPPSSMAPLAVLSCQCNGSGSCQLCIANRWNMANGGAMFLQFGPHPPMAQTSAMLPQQQQPPSSNATSPSFVNFPMSPEMMAAASSQVAPSPYTTATTRISLTLDLPSTDQVFCMMPTPNDVETFGADPKFGGVREFFCSNCGANGHPPEECCEATLDDITSAGQYHLNLRPNEEPTSAPPSQIIFQQETH